MPNTHCPDWATALLNGFSQIFLQRHPLCGLLCLLAILLTAPALLGGALLGGVAGLLTAQRRGYAKEHRQAGLFSYNGILLGLMLSLKLPWSPLLPPLIIAGGGISAMLTQQGLKRTPGPRCLPAYTAPFVGLGWLLLGFAPLSPPPASVEISLPNLLLAPLNGLGQVMFLDHPLAGALIAIGLLVANRRAAGWALFGSIVGVAFAWLHHDGNLALSGLGGYNPALVALALPQTMAATDGHCSGSLSHTRFRSAGRGAADGTVHPRLLAGSGDWAALASGNPRYRALHCAGQSP
jgi:urea transporter